MRIEVQEGEEIHAIADPDGVAKKLMDHYASPFVPNNKIGASRDEAYEDKFNNNKMTSKSPERKISFQCW